MREHNMAHVMHVSCIQLHVLSDDQIDRTIVDSHYRIVDTDGDDTILCISHSISETFLCTNNVTVSNCTSIYHINHVAIECS